MTPETLEAVRAVVRTATEKRPGEKQTTAFERASKVLGVSASTVANIHHGEIDACSEEKAQQILARKPAVLRDRLDFIIEVTRLHQEETRRLLVELKGWTAVADVDGAAGRQGHCDAPSLEARCAALLSSAPLLGGSSDDDAEAALCSWSLA